MAKTSKIVKNEERKALTARYREKRKALLAIVKNPKSTDAQREAAYSKLRKLPRNSSRVRIRNRCSMTGRSRGYEGFFGLGRMAMREMALNGLIPGVRKSSW
ncbi:MAG: 30S ribosomal protein S14 [Gemmatimonadaceae bacterium]|nr:30S ribosomal protein S14 [Gemmatimonadaceae bacterium]